MPEQRCLRPCIDNYLNVLDRLLIVKGLLKSECRVYAFTNEDLWVEAVKHFITFEL